MVRVEHYMDLVGDDVIADIYSKATPLHELDIVHINSTYYGGGVAEMLKAIVPLMNDVGIDAGWRVLHGTPEFFGVTKSFHNGLQGEEEIDLSPHKTELYNGVNQDFAIYTHLEHDYVIIHDPQPLPLIKYSRKKQPWFWRCHIDLSNPNQQLWKFLKKYILRYDRVIVSNDDYRNSSLPVKQSLIYPAIDPLSEKNRELSQEEIDMLIGEMKLPTDKPIITQVSRFDKWKDPLGVIDIYKKVKEKVDCRLVLCGSMASDDPEGYKIYDEVKSRASDLIDKGDVITLVNQNDIAVNALQRSSDVIIQKSLKEGFGLTATEALWKGKPVLCSNIGGFPEQIEDGVNGYLLPPDDIEGFADRTVHILRDSERKEKMGAMAKENVRKKFLVTRLMLDYMNMLTEHWYP